MSWADMLWDYGHRMIVPVALVAALAGWLAVVTGDELMRLEIDCERNPRQVWDTQTRQCVPRAHPPASGPYPPLATPNPINYPK